MRITKFAKIVAEKEGKKKSVDIAQISEILKIVNNLTYGILYALIRMM